MAELFTLHIISTGSFFRKWFRDTHKTKSCFSFCADALSEVLNKPKSVLDDVRRIHISVFDKPVVGSIKLRLKLNTYIRIYNSDELLIIKDNSPGHGSNTYSLRSYTESYIRKLEPNIVKLPAVYITYKLEYYPDE